MPPTAVQSIHNKPLSEAGLIVLEILIGGGSIYMEEFKIAVMN